MKYKIGDKVKLLGTKSYGNTWEYSMEHHNVVKGDIVTIGWMYNKNNANEGIGFNEKGGVFLPCDVEPIARCLKDLL